VSAPFSFLRAVLRAASFGAFALLLAFAIHPATAAAAETAPQTQISNTASATYTDTNGQSYTSNSNTVTTTVQNAPVVTNTNTNTQTISPGEEVVDTYVVTNTGNATGAVTVSTSAISTTGGASATYTTTYILNGAATGTCSLATPCSGAVLMTQAALASAAPGVSFSVGVLYTVTSGALPPGTVTTTLNASVTYAALAASGSAPAVPAETSATATATEIDTLKADARLDLLKSVVQPASASSTIAYTISGNNGGGFGAKALVSAGNLLGLTSTAGVIAVLDQVPHFTGATVQAALTGAPAVPTLPAGDTGTWYYTTATGGTSGWSTTFNPAATFIALFVTTTNSGGIVFPSAPSGSTGAGNVTTPQFTVTFSTTQPSGSGSADPGALSNIANSVIGGNNGLNGAPVIAPALAVDTDYETTTTTFPATTFAATAANVTASSTTGAPPGGASNLVTASAFASQTTLNGPLDNPAATGSYNGSVAVNNEDDFTYASFACSSGPAVNDGATQCAWPTANPVAIPNSFTNTGNGSDTFKIYATAPAGYIVQLFAVTGCPVTSPAVLPIAPYQASGGCTVGAAISAASASGGSVTTTAGIVVAAGATSNYVAEYKPSTGTTLTPFVPVTFTTIVYGTSGAPSGSNPPTLGPDANETTNVIIPGGPIKITKAQTIVANCPGTPAVSSGVCPSGTITYTLTYQNIAPAALAPGGAGLGTEPGFATAGINLGAGTLTLVDDGTPAGSWATTGSPSTFGVDASVAPASSTAGTLFTYTPNVALHATGSTTMGPAKISAQIGGAAGTLAPGSQGTVTFQVTVQ